MTRGRTGRPPSEELDDAIRLSTLELLAEVGFGALSLAEVARRAGSTTPAIYRRFANKTEVVLHAIRFELAQIAPEPRDSGSLRGDLIGWVEGITGVITPERNRILFGLLLAGEEGRSVRDELARSFDERIASEWAVIADRAAKRGELIKKRIPRLLPRIPVALVSQFSMMEQPIEPKLPREVVDTIILPALRESGALTGRRKA